MFTTKKETENYLGILNNRCLKLHKVFEKDKDSDKGKRAYQIGMNIFYRMQFLSYFYSCKK